MKVFKFILATVFVVVLMFTASSCGESFDRAMKDIHSDYNGGLYRKITIYDYNGKEIKSWEGKFDTQMGDASGMPYVKFDIRDSKGQSHRVIIQGGIIINEEIK